MNVEQIDSNVETGAFAANSDQQQPPLDPIYALLFNSLANLFPILWSLISLLLPES